MKQSSITLALALAMGTIALAGNSSATEYSFQRYSAYDCESVNGGASYSSGHLINNSGSSGWILCPIPQNVETGALDKVAIYTNASSSCVLCKNNQISYAQTCSGPTGSSSDGYGVYSYYWNLSYNDYLYYDSYVAQCYVSNGTGVYRFTSAIGSGN